MEVLGGAVAAMQASISAARLSLSGGLIRFAQNKVAGFKIPLHVTQKQAQVRGQSYNGNVRSGHVILSQFIPRLRYYWSIQLRSG